MILVDTGREHLARRFKNDSTMLAWGTVAPAQAWTTNPPPEVLTQKNLTQELGRRTPSVKSYVVPDQVNGTVEVLNTRWKLQDEPSRHVYLQYRFEPSENSSDVIYELGLFAGATVASTAMPQVTMQVNNAGGYAIGVSELQVDSVTGDSLGNLAPPEDSSPLSGRWVDVGGVQYRIVRVNASAGTIFLDRGLEASIIDNQTITVQAVTAATANQAYFTKEHILDPGELFLFDNHKPIFRNAASTEIFEFILSF